MALPQFDIAEAINQAISAAATVAGVIIGGWLAFRLGVRQLRRERAIDRRLDWQEKLLSSLDEYRSVLGVLVAQYENPPPAPQTDLRQFALGEATRLGRDVQAALRRAELYGTAGERGFAKRVFKTQLDIYIATWSYSANPAGEAQRLPEIKRLVVLLEEAQDELVGLIREELAMARVSNGRTPRTTASPASRKQSTGTESTPLRQNER